MDKVWGSQGHFSIVSNDNGNLRENLNLFIALGFLYLPFSVITFLKQEILDSKCSALKRWEQSEDFLIVFSTKNGKFGETLKKYIKYFF